MSLPINRSAKATLDANLVNGITSDAPALKASDDVVYNTIDELYNYALSLVTSGTLSPLPPDFLFRQAIINGNIDVCQRGTSFTLASGSSAYTADRFKSLNNFSGVNATVSQVAVTDLDGSKYGLQMVHASTPTAVGRLTHDYTLEAAESYKLAGKQVTFSCKVKAVGNINNFQVVARYRTTEAAISPSSTSISISSTIIITNSAWTTFTFTFTVPDHSTLTSSGVFGLELVGSKSVSEASGDGFIITQLEINTGNVAFPFQPRSFADELALCLRYYEKSYDYATAPATAATTIGLEVRIVPNNTIAVSQSYGMVNFKVQKRAAPTVVIYPLTTPSITGAVSDASSGVDLAANSGQYLNASRDKFSVRNGSGGTLTVSANIIGFHFAADSEL